mmetsp:Transcript_116673/g.330026  ORF Transcript_116673/g.330026 Transcript_116673/m.330026 type:complete len:215 (-) Transcript_116673:1004-1648(-)
MATDATNCVELPSQPYYARSQRSWSRARPARPIANVIDHEIHGISGVFRITPKHANLIAYNEEMIMATPRVHVPGVLRVGAREGFGVDDVAVEQRHDLVFRLVPPHGPGVKLLAPSLVNRLHHRVPQALAARRDAAACITCAVLDVAVIRLDPPGSTSVLHHVDLTCARPLHVDVSHRPPSREATHAGVKFRAELDLAAAAQLVVAGRLSVRGQ